MSGGREELVDRLREYISARGPGLNALLNALSRRSYGIDYAGLLISSPSKAYKLVRMVYGDNVHAVKVLVVDPLYSITGGVDAERIMELLEKGDDEAILGMLGLRAARVEGEPTGRVDKEDLRELLACAILIEKLTNRVYGKLSTLLPSPFNVAARLVSSESGMHAVVYEELYRTLFGDETPVCRRGPSRSILDYLEELDRRLAERPSLTELRGILEKLGVVESSVDAEYFMELAAKPILMALEPRLRKVYEPVLVAIMRDEQDHQRIVEVLLKEATGAH